MIYYIYKITEKSTGRYYIGKRCCPYKFIENDPYFGSGKWISERVSMNNRHSFKKEIIEICDSKEDVSKREAEIIGDLWYFDELCMNRCYGGSGGSLVKESNHRFDKIVYHWKHIDGRSENLTQYDFRIKYDLRHGDVSGVVNKRCSHVKGWYLDEQFVLDKKNKLRHTYNKDDKKYNWKHIDGREDYLTQSQFRQKYGIKPSCLVTRRQNMTKGWYLYKISSDNKSKDVYCWLHKDGRKEKMTPHEFYTKYGLFATNVFALIKGKSKSIKGWKIVNNKDKE